MYYTNACRNIRIVFAVFTIGLLLSFPSALEAASGMPVISAKSAVVMEASTKKVLYEKKSDERRYPASTTKMMTLITALEHGNLDETVTTSTTAANMEGSTLWLAPGEQLRLRDLLYGVMLVSGNDAATVVAEHVAGSVDAFSRLMTEKARVMGATNTNFTNSSGLPDPNHYSTAYDLALIAAYGYSHPDFRTIISTRHKTIPWSGKDHPRELYNENKILYLYEGGNGVKTGYTDAAGRCLVSGAKRGDIQLIAVVLDADQMWQDTISLLDYGFSQVKAVTLLKKGDMLKTVKVNNGTEGKISLMLSEDINVPVDSEDRDDFRTIIDAPGQVEAPLSAGQAMGKVRILYKDKEYASVSLVTTEAVERKSFFNLLWMSVWNFFTFIIKNIA